MCEVSPKFECNFEKLRPPVGFRHTRWTWSLTKNKPSNFSLATVVEIVEKLRGQHSRTGEVLGLHYIRVPSGSWL